MAERSLLGLGRGGNVDIRLSHGQTLDLKASRRVYQRSQVLLTDGYLSSVHVD